MSKKKVLMDFVEKYKHLPDQRSKEWLDDRKLHIGGSEISTIVGHNPYKSIRCLVENHLGLTTFTGNINTYWGTILENIVVSILEKKLKCKIYETGSLPGVIDAQKYSPDGLAYLDFLDIIILLEIKCAARRIADGRVPRMYKPQIYTGLDTVKIADIGLFVDALFRRCSIEEFSFSEKYDTTIHPDKPLGHPLALCMVCIYYQYNEQLHDQNNNQLNNYTLLKQKYGKANDEYIDAGSCCNIDLEFLLKGASDNTLDCFFPEFIDNVYTPEKKIRTMLSSFIRFTDEKNYTPIAVLPLKLFKLELVPVERFGWRKVYDRKTRTWILPPERKNDTKSYIQTHEKLINTVVDQIKKLDSMSPEDQIRELNKMYPLQCVTSNELANDLISSLL